jgi:hypothetical protein
MTVPQFGSVVKCKVGVCTADSRPPRCPSSASATDKPRRQCSVAQALGLRANCGPTSTQALPAGRASGRRARARAMPPERAATMEFLGVLQYYCRHSLPVTSGLGLMTGTGAFILIDGVPVLGFRLVRALTLREPASNADRRKTDRRPRSLPNLGTLRALGARIASGRAQGSRRRWR